MYQRWNRRRWKHHSPSTRTYESQYWSIPISHSWVAGCSSSSRQYTIPCGVVGVVEVDDVVADEVDRRPHPRIVFVNHRFSASRPVSSRPTLHVGHEEVDEGVHVPRVERERVPVRELANRSQRLHAVETLFDRRGLPRSQS